MPDKKRAMPQESTTTTGTRKSARVSVPVTASKSSAFDVKKAPKAKNSDEPKPSVESLKAQNEDLAKRLAVSKKQSAAYANLLRAEKEKSTKFRKNMMDMHSSMVARMEELREIADSWREQDINTCAMQ